MTEYIDRSIEGVIKAWFDYNTETGEITWKEWVSPEWYKYKGSYISFLKERAGNRVAFSQHPSGYFHVGAGGISVIFAHHIAWVLTYGRMPANYIDHIDGNTQNNTITNLRDVSKAVNNRNRKMRSDNTSGVTGVCWNKVCKKWYAQVTINGKKKNLGAFQTLEDAHNAREEFFAENTHLGYTQHHGKLQR